jgi:hypothetical protein
MEQIASITTWQRLEPRSTDDIAIGLQGRVHDPLWLLARQWQLGEFSGEDAGSPVLAHLQGDAFGLTRYLPGQLPANGIGVGSPIDISREPLETLVEKEPAVRGVAPDLRFAVDAGREFVRQLEAHGVGRFRGDYLNRYVLSERAGADDEPALEFLELMVGRVIDGALLYLELNTALRSPNGVGRLPKLPAIPLDDQDAVRKAAESWLAWYDSQVNEPVGGPAAWIKERMEYAFSVSAARPGGEFVLTTPEYVEGRLDWDAFSHRPGAKLGATPGESRHEVISAKLVPAPVSYPGMPASRWWEFEDAHVQFGAVRPAQQDLASMMFLQFALIFGNDWFVIPVELSVGTLSRLSLLNVTDSFGVLTAVAPFAQAGGAGVGWKMFTLAQSAAAPVTAPEPEMLFLPPSLSSAAESKPIEEVLLMRDEMANLAWAVEKFVESRTGDRIDRSAIYNAEHPPAQAAAAALSGSGRLIYKLATEVPDYWVPLVPVRANDGSVALGRGVMPHPDAPPSQPRGRILATGTKLTLFNEEVPRSGAHVTRSWQYTRWVDGSTHVWIGRRKEPGRGEGSSGLRFDSLELE